MIAPRTTPPGLKFTGAGGISPAGGGTINMVNIVLMLLATLTASPVGPRLASCASAVGPTGHLSPAAAVQKIIVSANHLSYLLPLTLNWLGFRSSDNILAMFLKI